MQVIYEHPSKRPDSLVVHLDGSLNALTADELWESASRRIDDGETVFVFDFTKVSMLTSAGIGILVRLYTRLKDREGSLAIFGCSSKIREIFTIVMLDGVLKVCDSEDQAWEAIEQGLETAAT
jgi:anti-sigma B factor antagonist